MSDNLKKEILDNIRSDRESIQSHIDRLQIMLDEADGPMAALIEFLTGAYRIKADINDQLIKLYNIEQKSKSNRSDGILNDILSDEE